MNKYWQKLEFDKILARLQNHCSFGLSKEMAAQLEPKKTVEKAREAAADFEKSGVWKPLKEKQGRQTC